MAFQLANRAVETTSTELTGTYTLNGAVTGFQAFGGDLSDGDTTYYTVTDGTSWEIGVGTWSIGPPATLTRDTILASSNSDSAVSWASGNKTVFIDVPVDFLSGVATDAKGSSAPNYTLTGTPWIDDSTYGTASVWLPKVYDGAAWIPDGYIAPDDDLIGPLLPLEAFADQVSGTDWGPAVKAWIEACSDKKCIGIARAGETYRIETLVWIRDKDDWAIIAHGAKFLIPDIEGPTGFTRPIKLVDCSRVAVFGGRFVSERTTSRSTLTNCLSVENCDDVEIAYAYFEGATGYGLVGSQDTENSEIFDLSAGAVTSSVTVTNFTVADFHGVSGYSLNVGLRENEQEWETSDVSTANDTITITDHGGITGQLCFILEGAGATLPAGLTHGRHVIVTVVDDDTLKFSKTEEDRSNGIYIDLTDVGAGTNSLILRRRLLVEGALEDYTVSGDTITFTNGGYQNKRVIVDVAKAMDNVRIHHCWFKDCEYFGLTWFPKVLSNNLQVSWLFAKDCGTADVAYQAFKCGAAYEEAFIHGLFSIGGNITFTPADWFTMHCSLIVGVNVAQHVVLVSVGGHGAYDNGDANAPEDNIYDKASHRLLNLSDVIGTWTPSYSSGGSNTAAVEINGTKTDNGPVRLSRIKARGWARTMTIQCQQPVPRIRITDVDSYDPGEDTHLTINDTLGHFPDAIEMVGGRWETPDYLTTPAEALAISSPNGLFKDQHLIGIGTAAAKVALLSAEGSDGLRIENPIFENCCPTATGVVVGFQTQSDDLNEVVTIIGAIVRGDDSGLTNLCRAPNNATIASGWHQECDIPVVAAASDLAAPELQPAFRMPGRSGKIIWYSGVPTSGTWAVGDEIWIFSAAVGTATRYRCVTAGTPGTWRQAGYTVALGATGSRPSLVASDIGIQYLDTTLAANGQPIWWDGSQWLDYAGAAV